MANGEYGDIGLRVRQRREELGLTREKMAERAGLSVQFMASVELGKQSMTTDSLKKVCRALCVSADYIVFGTRGPAIQNMTLTPPWSRSARNSAPMRNKCCAHLFRPYSPKGNIFHSFQHCIFCPFCKQNRYILAQFT